MLPLTLPAGVVAATTAFSVATSIKNFITNNTGADEEVIKKQVMKLGKDYMLRDSLISYTAPGRVEPITIIDERLAYQPYIHDVLQSATAIFAGYYLQAIALDSVIGDVKVITKIDKFNPNRSLIHYTKEDFSEGLPFYSRENASLGLEAKIMDGDDLSNYRLLQEMAGNDRQAAQFKRSTKEQALADAEMALKIKNRGLHHSGTDGIRDLKENANLSVGRMFEANFKYNDQEFSLPINIRLASSTIDPTSLLHILSIGKDNKSSTARFHGWRSGQLEFFKDIVFCEDLIKAHRTTLAKDKSGVYSEIMKRRNNNITAAAVSGELSVATASTIAVISETSANELEYQIGGKLSNYKVRDHLFESTYLMLLFIVDTEYEQVTVYHRGIANPSHLSIKDCKMAGKGDGLNVADILKTFMSGNAPSF